MLLAKRGQGHGQKNKQGAADHRAHQPHHAKAGEELHDLLPGREPRPNDYADKSAGNSEDFLGAIHARVVRKRLGETMSAETPCLVKDAGTDWCKSRAQASSAAPAA